MTGMDKVVALQRFRVERVAVLGTTDPAGDPHLVPLTFTVTGPDVVFAVDHKPKTTVRLRRLDNIAAHPRVSFLVQAYSDDWTELWWVRVDAEAAILTGGDEQDKALDALAAKYHQYRAFRPRGPVVTARIVDITGWSFTAGQGLTG